ncbi:pyocin knob domain-containing protein, partial [Citrobacter koseri]|uniref:pyocin knob domain-containing protein n=1 Tax=Citrobacter koseri TaxID=545 RepID=UPI001F2EBB77
MIIGFGNNVVSSLAADITASQTTIQVMPGTGAMFANLLTYDYANSSNMLKAYAKITITDAKETVFEICHLKSVSDDTLTVVRGREGTTAKGWALNDVIANFATRGSENQFVQIEHLQSGHYTAGVAGGTANALTLALPATYFVDDATEWTLRTPIVVYPSLNNTGAATLQLTLGGKALGTFPLYKGNKAPLVANDILKDVALVCLMDKTKTFFNVANPGAIYAGLGSAAFKDIVTSMTDITAGRIPVVGWMGLGGDAINVGADNLNNLPIPAYSSIKRYSPSGSSFFAGISAFCYKNGDGSTNFAEFMAPITGDTYPFVRNKDGMQLIFTNKNPPKPSDVGALPLATSALSVDLNTLGSNTAAGVYYQTMTANATTANHYPIAEAGALLVTPSAYGCYQEYTTFGSNRKFVRGLTGQWNGNGPWGGWKEYFQTAGGQMLGAIRGSMDGAGSYASQNDADVLAPFFQQINDASTSKFFPIIKQRYAQGNGTWSLGTIIAAGNFQFYYVSQSDPVGKTFTFYKDGQFVPGSYANFDARYQAKGSYALATDVYSKSASDARYVQNIRVSATQVRSFSDGGGYSSNDAAFATAIAMVGGSSNNGSLLVRYVQKN